MDKSAQMLSQARERLVAELQKPRARTLGKWFAALFVIVGLLGFLGGPPLLKFVLVKEMSKQLEREVTLESVYVNPYALSARITGLSVKADDGHEVAGFDELYVNLSTASIFKLAAAVDAIRLSGPRVAVVRLAEGRYDISDLLEKWMQPKEDTGTPRFSLNNIEIVGGKLSFDDRPKGRVHVVTDIHVGIPFISSLPYQAEVLVKPSFSATLDGAQVALSGDSKPFSESRESHLQVDLEHFDLAALQAYLPAGLPIRIGAGKLDTELKVVFKEVADAVNSLSIVGGIKVSDLALEETDGRPLLGWKRLDVDVDNADLANRNVAIGRVALEAPVVSLAVDGKGVMNLQRVAERFAAPGKSAAESKPESAPFAWSVGEATIADGTVKWRDESNSPAMQASIRDFKATASGIDSSFAKPLDVRHLSFRVDAGEAMQIGELALADSKIQVKERKVEIAELTGGHARLRMVRDKSGAFAWLKPPQMKPTAKSEGAPWSIKLAALKIDDVGGRFEDQTTTPAMIQRFDNFSLHGKNLGNAAGNKGSIALKGKFNGNGSLDVSGTVQAAPLDAALKIETVALPIMPLQPYFGEYLNVLVTRGQLSSQGDVQISGAGDQLKAAYKGSVTLGDFLAVDRINSADFLKWKSLYVGNVDFKLAPMSVDIGEIALTDFYSRLILNESGRLNVADIVRDRASDVAKSEPAPTPKSASAGAAKAALTPAAKPPVPIKIARVTLQNGTIKFSDFFVKPNYSVNLSKVAGRVTGLSSAEGSVADMDLRGSYANSAPVRILAKLNPLAARSFLDLKADVTGVDLVGLSPYSGKYAGYAIEKGKLSLNVAYRLEDRELHAENRIFIDQLTFGEKVESPDATKLPVNLAIALLKNSRGEIDINLPISGSLDDPQFSVGGIIFKVIGNLFVKAVTSPFKLLGSLFGGGEELSSVDFTPGRSRLDQTTIKKLESLSKAMLDRPRLELEIAGLADPKVDPEGLRRAAVDRAMRAEKLKDLTGKGKEAPSLSDIVIAPDEYKTYLTRAYKAANFPKPRNLVGLLKDLPAEEMELLMATSMPVSEQDLRDLAGRRAERVQFWLVEQGKVPAERVFLLPPKIAEGDTQGKAARVDFSLK